MGILRGTFLKVLLEPLILLSEFLSSPFTLPSTFQPNKKPKDSRKFSIFLKRAPSPSSKKYLKTSTFRPITQTSPNHTPTCFASTSRCFFSMQEGLSLLSAMPSNQEANSWGYQPPQLHQPRMPSPPGSLTSFAKGISEKKTFRNWYWETCGGEIIQLTKLEWCIYVYLAHFYSRSISAPLECKLSTLCTLIWVFPWIMVLFHTPKWFLVAKPMVVGETHHFRKPPYTVMVCHVVFPYM